MNTDNNQFDPTPRLKSSPVPILFIPFKDNENKCNYCGNEYSKTLKFEKKYCKNCLFWYIQATKNTKGNNKYLDVEIVKNNDQCIEHEESRNNIFSTTNVQKWCKFCSEISYFKQVISNSTTDDYVYYQIFSGWVVSYMNKKPISILNLPWWDYNKQCIVCSRGLKYIHQESESYCQKWCSCCFTIYSGCRYCLTTNIIFGITDRSQCKKCKRTSFINIDITNYISGNCIVDKFLASTRIDSNSEYLIANYMNNHTNTNLNPLNIYGYIKSLFIKKKMIEWIPYSQLKNLKQIAEGGSSIVYKAILSDDTCDSDIAVKELTNSQNISDDGLNEVIFNTNKLNFCNIFS
jgi:hypothetical protein